jgi:hypothetical protein
MRQVVLTTPQGQTIQAVCKEDDLSKPAAPETVRPLEQVKPLQASDANLTIAKSPDKGTLGNGQTAISDGCPNKQRDVIKMGQSGKDVKTIAGSKPLPMPAASTPQTPAQNIKNKAKDLQQMQPQTEVE